MSTENTWMWQTSLTSSNDFVVKKKVCTYHSVKEMFHFYSQMYKMATHPPNEINISCRLIRNYATSRFKWGAPVCGIIGFESYIKYDLLMF